jgi:thiamine biosynthesis protein ThiS
MNIKLNNRPQTFEEDTLTISDILRLKNYTFKMMVIKINGILIKKDSYSTAKVVAGDDVHIIHMISGG